MKKAIVLGGTHDHIGLIEILHEKGFYTILIDHLENPPAAAYADEHIRESTLDVEVVLDIAKNKKPEIVIAACIDQALLTMAHVCEKLGLPCHINAKTALELTNKIYMKQKFAENEIPTSNFFVLDKKDSPILPNEIRFPLVIKPADSNGSKGITKINTPGDIEKAVEFALLHSRSKQVILEEFVDGEEFSVDVAVKDFIPTVLMVTKNIKMRQSENTFTIIQSLFPATQEAELLDEIHQIAKKITKTYKIKNSPLLIQMIYHAGKLSVIEFSARIGGGSKHHFIKKITQFDLLEWFVNLFFSEPTNIKIKDNRISGCLHYFYAKNGLIKEFLNFDVAVADSIIEQYYLYKTSGMTISNHISSGDRVAGILITGKTPDDIWIKLQKANSILKIRDSTQEDLLLHGIP